MDYTMEEYWKLIHSLFKRGHSFYGFHNYLQLIIQSEDHTLVIIRHDVDRLPSNALKMAQIEDRQGIYGSYYFRVVPQSFDKKIIEQIANLGHEIGYHYEDLDLVVRQRKAQGKKINNEDELIDLAMESFLNNLEKLRKIYPVETICMHGSPMSKYDNRMLWDKYDYRDYGIIGEPYFDIDFNEVLYLTDTGRRWNASSISLRDKVESNFNYKFKTTKDIIENIDLLPEKILLNTHPQRWHDSTLPWLKELIGQNVKNVGKFILTKSREWPN